MHIEKNVFDNIMNTVMDTNRIKDNDKARLDLRSTIGSLSWTCNNWEMVDCVSPRQVIHYSLYKDKMCVGGCKSWNGLTVMLQTWVDLWMLHKEGFSDWTVMIVIYSWSVCFPLHLENCLDMFGSHWQYFRDLCSSTLRVNDLLVMEKTFPLFYANWRESFSLDFWLHGTLANTFGIQSIGVWPSSI